MAGEGTGGHYGCPPRAHTHTCSLQPSFALVESRCFARSQERGQPRFLDTVHATQYLEYNRSRPFKCKGTDVRNISILQTSQYLHGYYLVNTSYNLRYLFKFCIIYK